MSNAPTHPPTIRRYTDLASRAAALGPPPADADQRHERMSRVVDMLWDALAATGVSWVGFYLIDDTGEAMILGPRRDKPACSPIGMHGACGASFLARRPLVVRDVRDLGENYVACDPRDRSEVVVPCLTRSGEAWGVLDLDSWDLASFTDADAEGLRTVLRAAGLTA